MGPEARQGIEYSGLPTLWQTDNSYFHCCCLHIGVQYPIGSKAVSLVTPLKHLFQGGFNLLSFSLTTPELLDGIFPLHTVRHYSRYQVRYCLAVARDRYGIAGLYLAEKFGQSCFGLGCFNFPYHRVLDTLLSPHYCSVKSPCTETCGSCPFLDKFHQPP